MQYFYQIVGYKGHLRPNYWNSKRKSEHWHEFAQEAPAVDAIAGADSPLWVKTDGTGNPVTPFIELVMGVKPWGAISLLVPGNYFEPYIMPRMGYISPTRACPSPYLTSQYLSLSPIRFTDEAELQQLLKLLRPVKPSDRGGDDSKLNRYFREHCPKPERAQFEQARLLWNILQGGRTELPAAYGLPPLPANLRLAYLSHTFWIDPQTFEISSNEEEQSLDIGWYEPSTGVTKHFVIDEFSNMTKSSLDKSTYAHGESTTIAESEISSTLVALFNPLNSSGPIVLVTHDWPRTARLLRAHNIDTSAPNWREGVGELLGFERPRNGENQAAAGRNDNRHPDNANKSTNNGYSGYIDHDSKHECKVKPEVKEENSKLRLSSPTRRRSLSPRSRTRPLANGAERHHLPVFRPDEDEEEEGQIPDDTNVAPNNPNPSTSPEIYVIDLRSLLTTLTNTTRPYILYPATARRLGIQVDGWCAGNQARQMHDVLASLVSGKPVHQRQEELEKTPGVAAPNRTDANGAVLGNVPVVLEGIAGNGNATVGQPSAWDDDDSDDDW